MWLNAVSFTMQCVIIIEPPFIGITLQICVISGINFCEYSRDNLTQNSPEIACQCKSSQGKGNDVVMNVNVTSSMWFSSHYSDPYLQLIFCFAH